MDTGKRYTFVLSAGRCPPGTSLQRGQRNASALLVQTERELNPSRSELQSWLSLTDFQLHRQTWRKAGFRITSALSTSSSSTQRIDGYRNEHGGNVSFHRRERSDSDVETRWGAGEAPSRKTTCEPGGAVSMLQVTSWTSQSSSMMEDSEHTGTSRLQRMALLQLLGPSTSGAHATGASLLAGLRLPLPLPCQQPQQADAGPRQYQISVRAIEAPGADPDGGSYSPMQPLQLRAACLASVAAALVRLPQAYGADGLGGQNLWGVLLRRLVGDRDGTSGLLSRSQGHAEAGACFAGSSAGGGDLTGRPQAAALESIQRQVVHLGSPAPGPAHVGQSSEASSSRRPPAGAGASLAGKTRESQPSLSCATVAGASASKPCTSDQSQLGSRREAGAGVSAVRGGTEDASGSPKTGSRHAEGDTEDAKAQRRAVSTQPQMFENPIRYAKLLFAGAMSAVVSRTCVAPLERVKMDLLLRNGTRDALSTALQVMRTEGIAGFWKGNTLNVLRTAPFKAVNFFSFDMYHTALLALSGLDGNMERFAAGACAGVTATLVCFPLDVVRTRLLASVAGPRYGTGPFSTLAGILRNEGAAALYSGCLPAVIGMAPAGAVFYGVYDMLKHRHLESMAAEAAAAASDGAATAVALQPQATMPPLYTLLYGAMAGAASELIVYPLEVIRRKMQLQSMALAGMRQAGGLHHMGSATSAALGGALGPSLGAAAGGSLAAAAASHHFGPHQLGAQLVPHRALMMLSAAAVNNSPGLARIAAAVTAIITTDGPRGFYSGLLPNMLQVLPSAALSYYTYDTLKTVLGAR